MSKVTKQEREYAAEVLRGILKPGSTVYTKIEHVSQSGMSRCVSVCVVEDGEVRDVTYLVARATGGVVDSRHGGVRMRGVGMDMAFALVYDLSSALWPDGFACNGRSSDYTPTGRRSKLNRCRSNDHSNGAPYSKGKIHSNGGYALRHSSL